MEMNTNKQNKTNKMRIRMWIDCRKSGLTRSNINTPCCGPSITIEVCTTIITSLTPSPITSILFNSLQYLVDHLLFVSIWRANLSFFNKTSFLPTNKRGRLSQQFEWQNPDFFAHYLLTELLLDFFITHQMAFIQ